MRRYADGSRRSRRLSSGSVGRAVNVWRTSLERLRGGIRAPEQSRKPDEQIVAAWACGFGASANSQSAALLSDKSCNNNTSGSLNMLPLVSGDREGSPCVKGQSRSARSAVPLSLHQNGLSIGPSNVFGTRGPARPADTSLRIRPIYPPA